MKPLPLALIRMLIPGSVMSSSVSTEKNVAMNMLSVLTEASRDLTIMSGTMVPRSFAERTYRDAGYDTKVILGHKHQKMTDKYNDERLDDYTYITIPNVGN